MPKRVVVGVVTSAKMNKTRRVEIPRLVKHAKYGKIVHRRTICHVHDAENRSSEGDVVEIVESRPHSKTKRWDLVKVVQQRSDVDVAALKSAQQVQDVEGMAQP